MPGLPAVARVIVASPLPHLDRLFDYAIPEKYAATVRVGCRARVRFAGRLADAVVVEVAEASDFEGGLRPLERVFSPPSFTAAALELVEELARRYAGSRWDVLRLMAPPRVASVEKRAWAVPEPTGTERSRPSRPRTVLAAEPDTTRTAVPAAELVSRALTGHADGGSAVLVLPDLRAVEEVVAELGRQGLRQWSARGGGDVAVVHTDLGPGPRYGAYLAALTGEARVVVGTRPVALQPVPELRWIGVWDEGAQALQDPHAPYPHARTVAAVRADIEGAELLLAGFQPSVEAVALVEHGWARAEEAPPAQRRETEPTVTILGAEQRDREGGAGWHWLPATALRSLRGAMRRGTVLVMVPRAGYIQALACAACGEWAACPDCGGALQLPGAGSAPTCSACGRDYPHWHCTACRSPQVKRVRHGVEAVAEELRRMVPGVSVAVSSAAAGVISDGAIGGIVVATPGAAPAVPGGYALAVVVGAGTGLGSAGTEVQAARLWRNCAALCAPRGAGGEMVLCGPVAPDVERALRGSALDAARRAYADRAELGLPPATRTLEVAGDPPLVADLVGALKDSTRIAATPRGTVVIAPRGVMPAAIDRARDAQRSASSAGRELRLRVDHPEALDG